MTALIGVGTMNFGQRTPPAEAQRIVARALERGVTFFDTANVYGDGAAESLLGKALGPRRTEVQVATKVGLHRREGLGKKAVVAALEQSLARLGTEQIDLYTLHLPDPRTPLDETLDALAQLLEQKKIRAWGVSNFAAWQILELNHRCAARGLPPPAASQVLYNLLVRQLELEYFAFARAHPIRTDVYNPLAGGLLARGDAPGDRLINLSPGGPVPPPGSRFAANAMYRGRYWTPQMHVRVAALAGLAREAGLSLVTLAYAWLAARPGVDTILVGPATVAHLDAALDAAQVRLAPATLEAVDALHLEARGTDARYAR